MEKIITKVKSPIDRYKILTKDKVYEATETNGFVRNCGRGFNIISDEGEELICNEIDCAHLDGGNWIVVEEEKA